MTNTDKFKEVLSGIADNIRTARGTADKIAFGDLVEQSSGLELPPNTYILVDEAGNEVAATFVDEPVTLTATANDIRKGTTAVTSDGVITGEKEIPAYHTTEGFKLIPSGSTYQISGLAHYNFTKLQAIICRFSGSMSKSVAAEKVSIEGNVYDVGSNEALANVTVDDDMESINLGIANENTSPCVLRYFTYREVT